ncbi:MAG: hypothetical protein O3A01_08805, partial [bacterium]|nr:hypothetical protein [bacterium]
MTTRSIYTSNLTCWQLILDSKNALISSRFIFKKGFPPGTNGALENVSGSEYGFKRTRVALGLEDGTSVTLLREVPRRGLISGTLATA